MKEIKLINPSPKVFSFPDLRRLQRLGVIRFIGNTILVHPRYVERVLDILNFLWKGGELKDFIPPAEEIKLRGSKNG